MMDVLTARATPDEPDIAGRRTPHTVEEGRPARNDVRPRGAIVVVDDADVANASDGVHVGGPASPHGLIEHGSGRHGHRVPRGAVVVEDRAFSDREHVRAARAPHALQQRVRSGIHLGPAPLTVGAAAVAGRVVDLSGVADAVAAAGELAAQPASRAGRIGIRHRAPRHRDGAVAAVTRLAERVVDDAVAAALVGGAVGAAAVERHAVAVVADLAGVDLDDAVAAPGRQAHAAGAHAKVHAGVAARVGVRLARTRIDLARQHAAVARGRAHRRARA